MATQKLDTVLMSEAMLRSLKNAHGICLSKDLISPPEIRYTISTKKAKQIRCVFPTGGYFEVLKQVHEEAFDDEFAIDGRYFDVLRWTADGTSMKRDDLDFLTRNPLFHNGVEYRVVDVRSTQPNDTFFNSSMYWSGSVGDYRRPKYLLELTLVSCGHQAPKKTRKSKKEKQYKEEGSWAVL